MKTNLRLLLFFAISFLLFAFYGAKEANAQVVNGSGPNGGIAITTNNLGTGGWIVSAGQDFTLTVRISDFAGDTSTFISISQDGSSVTPGSGNFSVNPSSTRDLVFNVTAPNEPTNNCPAGDNDFTLSFSSSEYGFARVTIQLYASVGLTVNNQRSTSINATVVQTSWGGVTGQNFSVGANGSGGPSHRWAVNCGTHLNVTIWVSVGGVWYSGSAQTINGCSFQVTVTIPAVAAASPSPTPPSNPPPTNLSASPGCFGAGLIAVTMSWSLGSSNQIWIDISDNNWATYHNKYMGNTTSISWNAFNPMGDGFSPSYGTTYRWRLWDGVQHTSGPNFTTPGSCSGGASPTPTVNPSSPPAACRVDANFNITNPTLANFEDNWAGWDGHFYTFVYKVGLTRDQADYANYGWQGHDTLESDGSTRIYTDVNLAPDTSYTGEVYLHQSSGIVRWSSVSFTSRGCSLPTPTPTPTPTPVLRITVSGYSDCLDGVDPIVHLTWTSNTGSSSYTVQHNIATWQSAGTSNGLSWNSTAGQYPRDTDIPFRVIGGSTTSNTITVRTAACSPPPADPSDLMVSVSCDSSNNPEVTFRWKDNSNNELGFYLDINAAEWTGISSPTPWSNRQTVSTASEVTDFGRTVSQVWSIAVPQTSGSPLTPARNTTYWWRVAALSFDRVQSNHVYPVNTLTPPGVSFTTPSCSYDFALNLVPGNDQNFDIGENASVTVRIYNSAQAERDAPIVAAPRGVGLWPKSTAPVPTCPASPQLPGGANSQGLGTSRVLVPGGPSNAPSYEDLTFNFNVGTTAGVYTAYFYALPNCDIASGTPAADLNWANNVLYFTYSVQAKSWLQTIGGGVGARGQVTMSYDPLPAETYGHQSSYGLVANNVNNARGQWEVTNYSKALFPPNNGSVHDYLSSRFRSKANGPSECSLTPGNLTNQMNARAYIQCSGNATLTGTLGVTPTNPNVVVFVDGNLNVSANFTVSSAVTIIFVVAGNITVESAANTIHGIYVTKGSFVDCTNVCNGANQLNINGGVYAGNLSLGRVLPVGPPNLNDTQPAVKITYEPKYLIGMSSVLGSATVDWREVAP